MCTKTESLLGIDFPLDEYNTKYDPTLIPTKDFSHKFLFKEYKGIHHRLPLTILKANLRSDYAYL